MKLIRSKRWEQNAGTKPQNLLLYVAFGMSEGTILPPEAKQKKKHKERRREKEEKGMEREEKRTLIINATGHRPFLNL